MRRVTSAIRHVHHGGHDRSGSVDAFMLREPICLCQPPCCLCRSVAASPPSPPLFELWWCSACDALERFRGLKPNRLTYQTSYLTTTLRKSGQRSLRRTAPERTALVSLSDKVSSPGEQPLQVYARQDHEDTRDKRHLDGHQADLRLKYRHSRCRLCAMLRPAPRPSLKSR